MGRYARANYQRASSLTSDDQEPGPGIIFLRLRSHPFYNAPPLLRGLKMADTNETTARSLRSGTDHRTKWYPISIERWNEVLNCFSYDGNQILPDKDIRKNIAYNLQYLEYLEQTIEEISLSAVLLKQTYKSYIIVGIGVVEALLFFINAATGGSEKKFFDVLNRLRSKAFLRTDKPLYEDLQRFRKLRNKVHLHEFRDDRTTDYATFSDGEFNQMRKILYKLITKRKLGLPDEMLDSFGFLNRPVHQTVKSSMRST